MSKNIQSADSELLRWPVEMLRIAPSGEAERLSGLSWETLKRLYPDKVIRLSERIQGMRVGHCLMLPTK